MTPRGGNYCNSGRIVAKISVLEPIIGGSFFGGSLSLAKRGVFAYYLC